MNNLILVRHGQSQWNKEKRFTGWADIDLTKQGEEEAEYAGKLIKELKVTYEDIWKELNIINELTADEFLDFIRADFGVSKMVKLATHHPKMIVRQLFNMVKGT